MSQCEREKKGIGKEEKKERQTHEPTRSQHRIFQLVLIQFLPYLAMEGTTKLTRTARTKHESFDSFAHRKVDKGIDDWCWIRELAAEEIDGGNIRCSRKRDGPCGRVVPVETDSGVGRAG